ncbi:MAG TPA: hypothetical protein VFE30_14050 [Anaeromyxobacteraceae bacterium]|nr:hypothetical protein [Anaeromyxobacteraceae bacterium]
MARTSVNALPRWQLLTVVLSATSLLASGLAWLVLHYAMSREGMPHPLEAWALRWHGLSAPVALFAAGFLAAGHIGRGWRLGRHRASGLGLALLSVAAVLTGYALSYLVGEGGRPAMGFVHAALGVVAFALGALHAR